MSIERERAEGEPRLEAVRHLPRALEPGRDLWPEIEPRLRPRRAGARRWAMAYQLAAALALLVAGGALSQLLWPAASPAPGAVAVAAAVAAEPELAEAQYLRAKEALWLSAYGRREDLSPATMRVVEHNLRIIDEAIRELRQALDGDPGNHHLEGMLYANHRRSIELLRRLAEAPQEI